MCDRLQPGEDLGRRQEHTSLVHKWERYTCVYCQVSLVPRPLPAPVFSTSGNRASLSWTECLQSIPTWDCSLMGKERFPLDHPSCCMLMHTLITPSIFLHHCPLATHMHTCTHTHKQHTHTHTHTTPTHPPTHTQTDRQTDRQTGRQTGRQAGRQTDRQTDRHTDRQFTHW